MSVGATFAEQCGIHDEAREAAAQHTARLIEASGGFSLLLLGAAAITLLSLVMIIASRPHSPTELEPV